MRKTIASLFISIVVFVFSFSILLISETAFAQELTNPLSTSDPKVFLANLVRIALGLLSIIALVMFIYGGLTFLTSGGNEQKISRAKATLVWATIGIVVIFGSYSLLSFIVNTIVKSASTP